MKRGAERERERECKGKERVDFFFTVTSIFLFPISISTTTTTTKPFFGFGLPVAGASSTKNHVSLPPLSPAGPGTIAIGAAKQGCVGAFSAAFKSKKKVIIIVLSPIQSLRKPLQRPQSRRPVLLVRAAAPSKPGDSDLPSTKSGLSKLPMVRALRERRFFQISQNRQTKKPDPDDPLLLTPLLSHTQKTQERLVAELAARELEVAGTKEQVAARLLEALAARRKAANSGGGGGVEEEEEAAAKKAAAPKKKAPATATTTQKASSSSKSSKLSKAGRRAAVIASEAPRRAAAAAAAAVAKRAGVSSSSSSSNSSSSSSSSSSHPLPPGTAVASPRALERLPKSVLVASVVVRRIFPDERAAAAATKQRLAAALFAALEAEAAELELEEEEREGEGAERDAEEQEYAAELAR